MDNGDNFCKDEGIWYVTVFKERDEKNKEKDVVEAIPDFWLCENGEKALWPPWKDQRRIIKDIALRKRPDENWLFCDVKKVYWTQGSDTYAEASTKADLAEDTSDFQEEYQNLVDPAKRKDYKRKAINSESEQFMSKKKDSRNISKEVLKVKSEKQFLQPFKNLPNPPKQILTDSTNQLDLNGREENERMDSLPDYDQESEQNCAENKDTEGENKQLSTTIFPDWQEYEDQEYGQTAADGDGDENTGIGEKSPRPKTILKEITHLVGTEKKSEDDGPVTPIKPVKAYLPKIKRIDVVKVPFKFQANDKADTPASTSKSTIGNSVKLTCSGNLNATEKNANKNVTPTDKNGLLSIEKLRQMTDRELIINLTLLCQTILTNQCREEIKEYAKSNKSEKINSLYDLGMLIKQNFPLNTIKQFEAFNDHLNENEDFEMKFREYCDTIGGKDSPAIARAILRLIISDSLGNLYSLKGQLEKLAFEETKFYHILEVAAINSSKINNKIADVRLAVSNWLKSSKSRIDAKKLSAEKKKKSAENAKEGVKEKKQKRSNDKKENQKRKRQSSVSDRRSDTAESEDSE